MTTPDTREAQIRLCSLRIRYRKAWLSQADSNTLASLLTAIESVNLSGYDTDLYNDMLKGWSKRIKTTAANGASGSVKRTECLWVRLRTEEFSCGTNFSFL
ncbi:hypothetical protein [Pantoea ananatis]|uniref:hypothetical protein n=1 Tax=Pantoea ananas TaxID=553 RepID=UPI0023508230|nr:hypothetical protein [Pantoea ananatis]MDC7860691.1 hypothetical protein [Pantoea ananatis]